MKKENHLKKYFSSIDEFYRKRNDIIRQIYELEDVMYTASDELCKSVDNGIDAEYVIDVIEDFKANKFRSSKLKDFMKKVIDLCFGGFDRFNEFDWKDNLNLVNIDYSYDDYSKYYGSHIALEFNRVGTKHVFTLKIPIKMGTRIDITNWDDEGCYVVLVYPHNENSIISVTNKKMIARCFDPSNLLVAIDNFMSGKYDNELMCEDITQLFQRYQMQENFSKSQSFDLSDDSYYGRKKNKHDFLSSIMISLRSNSTVWPKKENCIDDLVTDVNKFMAL